MENGAPVGGAKSKLGFKGRESNTIRERRIRGKTVRIMPRGFLNLGGVGGKGCGEN